jgi:hypothetical protein
MAAIVVGCIDGAQILTAPQCCLKPTEDSSWLTSLKITSTFSQMNFVIRPEEQNTYPDVYR